VQPGQPPPPAGWGYGYPPYGPPPVPPPPLKPGCVPLRPLSVSDILDGSFQVIRRNPRATLGLSAIVAVPSAALTLGFQAWTVHGGATSDPDDPSAAFSRLGDSLLGSLGLVLIGAFIGAILTGMLAAVVTEDVLGHRLTIGQAWLRARPRIGALIGLALITTVLEVLGLIPCLVIGVWLWGIWAVAVPVMMVEGTSVRRSLSRSKQLVDGLFWRVWGIRALGTLLVMVVATIINLPFQVLGGVLGGGFSLTDPHLSAPYLALTAVGSILSATITAPVRSAIDALLYVDLRMRKEGLDLVLQQRAAPLLPLVATPYPPNYQPYPPNYPPPGPRW
jgi:hypothetical protein